MTRNLHHRRSVLSGERLHGMPKRKKQLAVKKLAKTQRKPSVPFSGMLSGRERKRVFEEAAQITIGEKQLSQVSAPLKPFVGKALEWMREAA